MIRPADANETSEAWRVHLNSDGPSAIILTRQKLPVLETTAERARAGVARGGYTVVDEHGSLDLVLVGTGSEVPCVSAAQRLLAAGTSPPGSCRSPAGSCSTPSSAEARSEVFPAGVPTLAVEAGTSLGWERFADDSVALDRFGASAPGEVALAELGYTPENVAGRARALLARGGHRPAPAAGLPGSRRRRREREASSHELAHQPDRPPPRIRPEPLVRQPAAQAHRRAATWPGWWPRTASAG